MFVTNMGLAAQARLLKPGGVMPSTLPSINSTAVGHGTNCVTSDGPFSAEQLFDVQLDAYFCIMLIALFLIAIRVFASKFRRFTSLIFEGACYIINIDKRAFKLTFAGELHLLYCTTLNHKDCQCKVVGSYFKDAADYLTRVAKWNFLPRSRSDTIRIDGRVYKLGIFLVFIIDSVSCGTGLTSANGITVIVLGSIGLCSMILSLLFKLPRLFYFSIFMQSAALIVNSVLGDRNEIVEYVGMGCGALSALLSFFAIILTNPVVQDYRESSAKETDIQRSVRAASTNSVNFVGNSTKTIFHTKHHLLLTLCVLASLILLMLGGISAASLGANKGTSPATTVPTTPMRNPFEFHDLDSLLDYVDIHTSNKTFRNCTKGYTGVEISKFDTSNHSELFYSKIVCLPPSSTVSISLGSTPEAPKSLVPFFKVESHEDLYDHVMSIFFMWFGLCTSFAIWRAYHRMSKLLLPCNFSDRVWYIFVNKDVIKVLNDGSVHGLYCSSITYSECQCQNNLWFITLKNYFKALADKYCVPIVNRNGLYLTGSVYTVFGALFFKIKEIGAFDPLEESERLAAPIVLGLAAIVVGIMAVRAHWFLLWLTLAIATCSMVIEASMCDRLPVYKYLMFICFGLNTLLLMFTLGYSVFTNRRTEYLHNTSKGNVNIAMSQTSITKESKGPLTRNIYPVRGTTLFMIMIKVVLILLVVGTALGHDEYPGLSCHDFVQIATPYVGTIILAVLLSISVLCCLALYHLYKKIFVRGFTYVTLTLSDVPSITVTLCLPKLIAHFVIRTILYYHILRRLRKFGNYRNRIKLKIPRPRTVLVIFLTLLICLTILPGSSNADVIDQGEHVYGCNCKEMVVNDEWAKTPSLNRHILLDLDDILVKVDSLANELKDLMSFTVPACGLYGSKTEISCVRMFSQIGSNGKMYLGRTEGGFLPMDEFKYVNEIKVPYRNSSMREYYFNQKQTYDVADYQTSAGFFARRYGITTLDMTLLKQYPRYLDPLSDPAPRARILGIWTYYSHTSSYCTHCVKLSDFKKWKKLEQKAIADLTTGEQILTADVSNHTAALKLIAGKFDIINDNIAALGSTIDKEMSRLEYERLLESLFRMFAATVHGNSLLYADAHMDLQNLMMDATKGGRPTLAYPFVREKVFQLAKSWGLGKVVEPSIEVNIHKGKLYIGFKTETDAPKIPDKSMTHYYCDYCVSKNNNGFSVLKSLELLCRDNGCQCKNVNKLESNNAYRQNLQNVFDFYDNALCIIKNTTVGSYILHDPNDHLYAEKVTLTDGFITTTSSLMTFSSTHGEVDGTEVFDVNDGYDIRKLQSGSYTLTNDYQRYAIETLGSSLSLTFPIGKIRLDSFRTNIIKPPGIKLKYVTTQDIRAIVNRSEAMEAKAHTLISLADQLEKHAANISFKPMAGDLDLGGAISNVLSGIGKGGLALLEDVASIPAKILSSTFLTFIPYIVSGLALAVAIFWPIFLNKSGFLDSRGGQVDHESKIPEEIEEVAV